MSAPTSQQQSQSQSQSTSPARGAQSSRQYSDTSARGVRRLIGPVHAHILDRGKRRRYESFASFHAGDPSDKAVEEVELTARRLHAGTIKLEQTPVVLEDDLGQFIGYCSVHARPVRGYPDGEDRPWIAERYIVAFGRDLRYRKYLLSDGKTYVGETLVRAGLDLIAIEADGGPMPSVSALVRSDNTVSHRIFDALGFENRLVTSTGFTQDLRWREAGAPLPPPLASEVYVPPERPLPPSRGRNYPCPCGSGKKYKKCCGR